MSKLKYWKTLQVSVPKRTADWVAKLSKRNDKSISAWLRDLLESAQFGHEQAVRKLRTQFGKNRKRR